MTDQDLTEFPRLTSAQIKDVLAAVEQRKHSDAPYPNCFVCGTPVEGQLSGPWVGGEGEALLTVRPCGHRMTYNTETVAQIRREMDAQAATEATEPAEDSELEALRREVAAARKFAAEMREFCSPQDVGADWADRLIEAMDRAKEGR